MRLQRNLTEDNTCKYAIVRLDKLREMATTFNGTPKNNNLGRRDTDDAIIQSALEDMLICGVLEYGKPGDKEECFVIKLKDQFAAPTLQAYVRSVRNRMEYLYAIGKSSEADSLKEYANDVEELAARANVHPDKHYPD